MLKMVGLEDIRAKSGTTSLTEANVKKKKKKDFSGDTLIMIQWEDISQKRPQTYKLHRVKLMGLIYNEVFLFNTVPQILIKREKAFTERNE